MPQKADVTVLKKISARRQNTVLKTSDQVRSEGRLKTQSEVGKILIEAANFTPAVSALLESIGSNLAWDLALLWQLGEKKDHLKLAGSWHSSSFKFKTLEKVIKKTTVQKNEGFLGCIWNKRQPMWIPDINSHKNFDKYELAKALKKAGLRGGACFPIFGHQKNIGFIVLFSKKSLAIDRKMVTTIESISGQIGQFIEHKRDEEKLRQAKEQLETILEGVADGIIVQDREGKIIYANKAAETHTGFHKNQSLSGNRNQKRKDGVFELFDKNGGPIKPTDLPGYRAIKGQHPQPRLIGWRNRATGKTKWLLIKSTPIFDDEGKAELAINIIDDITSEIDSDRRREYMIGNVSHELKNLLTSIKAFTQLIRRQIKKTDDKISYQYTSLMESQVDNLIKLINDLLDTTKIHAGKLEIMPEEVNIEALTKKVIADFELTSNSHKIEFKGHAGKILVDKTRIYQVIGNLLSNAIKYSPNSKKVVVGLKEDEKNITLSVTDYGIGIPPEYKTKIFEPYSRIQQQGTYNFPGLGLGLYLSSEIIKRHNGKIWYKSQEGKGSTFYVTLPSKSSIIRL